MTLQMESSIKRRVRSRSRRDASYCAFQLLQRLNVDEAVRLYQDLYVGGKQLAVSARQVERGLRAAAESMPQYGNRWVIALIPIDHLNYQTEAESSDARVARARSYAARPGVLPPGLATYHSRSTMRQTGKAYVKDGNHRVLAATYRGECDARMLMPEDEFFSLVHDVEGRGRHARQ